MLRPSFITMPVRALLTVASSLLETLPLRSSHYVWTKLNVLVATFHLHLVFRYTLR